MGSDEQGHSYRCIAASVEGFIQQVAVSYIRTGHFFYVPGTLQPDADAAAVDAKIIRQYGIDISRWGRALRKQRGEANLQYIRHDRFFVIFATHGTGLFFQLEGEQVRDCRRMPIKFAGYSLSYRGGHPHVRIDLDEYNAFKSGMVDLALHTNRVVLESLLGIPRYVPYAPVRRQLWNIWREVNRVRAAAGLDLVSQECLPLRRRIVRPFGPAELTLHADEPAAVPVAVDVTATVATRGPTLEEKQMVIDELWDALRGPGKNVSSGTALEPSLASPVGSVPIAPVVTPPEPKPEPLAVFPQTWLDGHEVGDGRQSGEHSVSGHVWPGGTVGDVKRDRGREP